MMPPTLVEVQFARLPLGPPTVIVLVAVVFGYLAVLPLGPYTVVVMVTVAFGELAVLSLGPYTVVVTVTVVFGQLEQWHLYEMSGSDPLISCQGATT
jgi:hypothetical protein